MKTTITKFKFSVVFLIFGIVIELGFIYIRNSNIQRPPFIDNLSLNLPTDYVLILLPIVAFIIEARYYHLKYSKNISRLIDRYKKIDNYRNDILKENINAYVNETEKSFDNFLDSLFEGESELDKSQFYRFIKIVFQKSKLTYKAIDVSLPSEYIRKYGGIQKDSFLYAHEQSLDKKIGKQNGYRIIARNDTDIRDDAKKNLDDFDAFWKWHQNNKIYLGNLSKGKVETKITNNGIDPKDCDLGIGLWGNEFAVLFSKPSNENGGSRIKIIKKNNKTEFNKIVKICEEIKKDALELHEEGLPKMMNQEMIELMENYISPSDRWATIKEFMYHFLLPFKEDKRNLLDVAAGMGVDYLYLHKAGFYIDANEVQKESRIKGKTYCKREELNYDPIKSSWEDLSSSVSAGKYHAVLCTGNSLRMLNTTETQLKSIQQFYYALQEGGILIIDERNHEGLVAHEKKINQLGNNRNDLKLFKELSEIVSTPKNPLYHGNIMKSIPFKIRDEGKVITFCYYKNENVTSLIDAEKHKIQDWEFFHYKRMEEILSEAGFMDIEKYGDYSLDKKRKNYEDTKDDAMFVYVAKKLSKS